MRKETKLAASLCALVLLAATALKTGHVRLQAAVLPPQDANWFVGHSHVLQNGYYEPCYRLTLGRLNLRAVPPYVDPNLPSHYYSAAILCVVKDEAGQPIRGAWVTSEGTHHIYPARYVLMNDLVARLYETDRRGMHELRRLVPGQYRVDVRAKGYWNATQTVQVGPDAVATATIVLRRLGSGTRRASRTSS